MLNNKATEILKAAGITEVNASMSLIGRLVLDSENEQAMHQAVKFLADGGLEVLAPISKCSDDYYWADLQIPEVA